MTQFLGFNEMPTEFVIVLSLFLLIEISISYPIHVHNYEYFVHGCSYICLYMMVYIL